MFSLTFSPAVIAKTKKMKKFLFSTLILSMFFSCQMKHSMTPAPAAELTAAPAAEGGPEILFLQVKVWKKETAYGAEVQSKKQVAGLLNRDIRGMQPNEGEWLVSFLDKNNQVIEQVAVPDPLNEHYETTDDQGKLLTVEVKKEEADCFIRVQYDSRFSSLQIEQIAASQQRTKIIFLKL